MSLSSRTLRCSLLCLLTLVSAVCAAQPGVPQFIQPLVEYTGGQVTGFAAGSLQGAITTQDFLYINAPTVSGTTSSVLVGELLSKNQGQGFQNLDVDQITFTNVTNVVAALAPFSGRGITDYAFALSSTTGPAKLCVYYGTGNGLGGDAYDGPGAPPNQYPPTGGKSGCMTFATQGMAQPIFSTIAAPSFQTNLLPQLLIEDSANNFLYVFSNTGAYGNGSGQLTGFTLVNTISIPAADGTGPIAIGDFDHDGNTDFIVNGQAGNSATIYFGDGTGTAYTPLRLPISGHIHSLLLRDMDGDGIPDLVAEGDNGSIQIYKGAYSSTAPFGAAPIGGTAAGVDGFTGNGGHLAAIADVNGDNILDILTTTPIGLSVLLGQGNLAYKLHGIYNIGPGRSSYALGQFLTNGANLDLAVDSPEGVAIVLGDANGDGGFQTSNAYSALQPALGATIGRFRNAAHNPNGAPDVAVDTGATQAQLLINNGSGGFSTFPAPANTTGTPTGVPANLWSNLVSGNFNGDGVADLAYSLTGYPTPLPGIGPAVGPGLYVQLSNGDGTFQPPAPVAAPANNNLYGETVVGDFNGDGIADLANTDWKYLDTLLGQTSGSFSVGLNQQFTASGFVPVAAGFFREGRTGKQDLVIAAGGALYPFLNSGDGKTFTAMPKIPTAILPVTLLLADLDGDGSDDIMLLTQATDEGSAPNQMLIWWGNGDGTFSGPTIYSLARDYYLGAIADMNSDGRPDILLSDGQIVSILYNLGPRTFKNDFGTNCSPCGEQHFLAGQGINSLTLASVAGSSKPDLVVANGGLTLSNAIVLAANLPAGSHSPTATLTPNTDVNTGGITVLANNITTLPVSGTLTANPEPSSVTAAFTLTATLTPSLGVALPTGTVEFYFDGAQVGGFMQLAPSISGTSSTASYTVPAGNTYTSGPHALTAFYGGDAVNSQLTLSGTHSITDTATTTTLYLCVAITLACPVNGTITPPPPPYPTSLTMFYGQSFNGVTSATANDGTTLTGTLNFNDFYNGVTTTLCTLPVGVAGACPPSVGSTLGTGVGIHVFTSAYSGDSTHAASTSPAVTLTVLPDTVTASLTGSPNPQTQGQPVTFTATFTGNFAAPTGPVQFIEAFPPTTTEVVLGTATLVPGSGLTSTATFTTSTLPVGSDTILASYQATTDFGAASASTIEVINPLSAPSFTLAVTPTSLTTGVGENTGLTVTVTPQNGFTQTVNLSCANLPYEVTCIFIPPTIAAGGGTASLFVSNTAPHTCGTTQPYFLGGKGNGPLAPFAVPALAGLLAFFLPGRRRRLRALAIVILAATAMQLSGCGNCTDLGTRPGTYTFQVVATSTGGASSETQSVPITLTVKI